MELHGDLVLERSPGRRWVSIIAVVIPVVACVAGVAWFVRAFISPPTVSIPSPMMLASAPPAIPQHSQTDDAPASRQPPPPEPEPRAAPAAAVAPASLPMFATLSAAPPVFPPVPGAASEVPGPAPSSPAYADPAREARAPAMSPEPAAEPSEPIAGPIPLPKRKPHQSVASIAGPVPLPRPRPTEAEGQQAPLSDVAPDYTRHGAE